MADDTTRDLLTIPADSGESVPLPPSNVIPIGQRRFTEVHADLFSSAIGTVEAAHRAALARADRYFDKITALRRELITAAEVLAALKAEGLLSESGHSPSCPASPHRAPEHRGECDHCATSRALEFFHRLHSGVMP